MPEILTIVPSYSSDMAFQENATVVAFGDGYEQRTPIGINAKRLSFHLVYDRVTSAKAAAVLAFFRQVGNTGNFQWTPPAPYDLEGPRHWVARPPLSHVYVGFDCESVDVRIDEDFNPV